MFLKTTGSPVWPATVCALPVESDSRLSVQAGRSDAVEDGDALPAVVDVELLPPRPPRDDAPELL